MSDTKPRLIHGDYSVAVICAMEFEMSAVRYMLDEEHQRLPTVAGDQTIYTLGTLSGHNVVLACLPGTQGKAAAATVAVNLERTFPSIQWRVFVGIGGGVPTPNDVRLGDVVVSMPDNEHGGLVQYDLGSETTNGFVRKGFLTPPPALLRSAVTAMKSDHLLSENRIGEFLSRMLQRGRGVADYSRPTDVPDILFPPRYVHPHEALSCQECDRRRAIVRADRESNAPKIHYGLIASGDSVMKNAVRRDELRDFLHDILCFEMEAAGWATEYSCIVIRGISDYSDSHKNYLWQKYAAAVAAACCKELLSYVTPKSNTRPSDRNDRSPSVYSTFAGRGVHHSGSGNMSIGGNLNIA
ncbi:purine and uridine phosphorylase [Hypoxylon rubiginosum]|uniref:Purine and uridine phosphorylase n=1 Tax=Hypoxylon rubiginosum TaxID=110542 RepID=A0ACC0D577_9PEZI|nr:purine and uridine phosphorylase [Hypoxylon rubiginosum]